MKFTVEALQEELKKESFIESLECFIIFGSYVYCNKDPNDVDICVVVKDRDANLELLSNYVCSKFENPDLTIYFKDELESGIPFADIGNGIFAVEYLSYGIPLYGENVFKSLLMNVDQSKYRESLLQKAFEYVLRLRVVYYSDKNTEYKKNYFYKYVTRLAKSILLFLGSDYSGLMTLSNKEVFGLLIEKGIIKRLGEDTSDLDSLFKLFEELNLFLLTLEIKE